MKFDKPKDSGNMPWLKVTDVPNSDLFVIMDEIRSGRGKFEKEGEGSGVIKRKSDGKEFLYTFREFHLKNLIGAYGDDSTEWIGKTIEFRRKISKNFNKAFLALEVPIDEIDIEKTPF